MEIQVKVDPADTTRRSIGRKAHIVVADGVVVLKAWDRAEALTFRDGMLAALALLKTEQVFDDVTSKVDVSKWRDDLRKPGNALGSWYGMARFDGRSTD